MTQIDLFCRGDTARAEVNGQITTGSLGIPVVLHWGAEWDGLAKTVYFRNAQQEPLAVQVVVGENTTVPWEVLRYPGRLEISAEGISRDGSRVLHTRWMDCGSILEAGGSEKLEPPTPELAQQLLTKVEAAVQDLEQMARRVSGLEEPDTTLTKPGVAADAAAVGAAILPHWQGTQAEFDSITVKDAGTLYLIVED